MFRTSSVCSVPGREQNILEQEVDIFKMATKCIPIVAAMLEDESDEETDITGNTFIPFLSGMIFALYVFILVKNSVIITKKERNPGCHKSGNN